jgi:predicted dehydrogenase
MERRGFLYTLSCNIGLAALAAYGGACGNGGTNREPQRQKNMAEQKNQKKLGIALVGLGKYSTGQLAPALQETMHCYLAGIVTGSAAKAADWQQRYGIPDKNVYNYDNFEAIKDNPDIDIVYIVLPNSLHAAYSIKASQAGKHVICEKPMAISVEECDSMIAASRKAGKKLSIGYRLHFEPHNMEVIRMAKEKPYGDIRKVIAEDGMASTEGWRLLKSMAGGGPLMDVGIYCVQAACYGTNREPVAVTAKEGPKTKPELFKTIEQSLAWQMEFPDGITAECKCSYADEMNLLHIDAEKGWIELEPAYEYGGLKGKTHEGKLDVRNVNQQARQMDDFALAIMNNRPTPVPGEMGRRDVNILMAIYKAMETGRKVEISPSQVAAAAGIH